jgi:hypothetical protein
MKPVIDGINPQSIAKIHALLSLYFIEYTPKKVTDAYRGNGGKAPCILYRGTRRRRVVSFTLRSPCSKRKKVVSIGMVAVWASEPVWSLWGRDVSLQRIESCMRYGSKNNVVIL